MSIKSWVLGRVHQMGGLAGRADLPGHSSAAEPSPGSNSPHASPPAHEAPLTSAEHLGAYGSLIGAIRDELEHFVASHVRLHLAIADRDRFVLTAIDVHCLEGEAARQRLTGFMREFKPEQVKRYLAREVIGALPNAAAIDLSQFAGLQDADARDEADGAAGLHGEYHELLEALRVTPPPTGRPYRVSVVGRWAELDSARPTAPGPALAATPATPLAGQRCEFDLEDGDGRRRIVLQSVVPGRRYVVGTGEGCDIRVRGTYASRRHAELWLDQGVWWVGDAGSTNGVRVEPAHGRRGPGNAGAAVPGAGQPIVLGEGARIVLSARADGPADEYPWLALRPAAQSATRPTPIARGAAAAAPKTPLTAISPPRAGQPLEISVVLADGVRTLPLHATSLPLSVGRSRHQTLVIDRSQEAVSGHHLDITAIDASAAEVKVHGDNGVLVNGVRHGPGERFRWQAGETMLLGAPLDGRPGCTMTLTRRAAG
jgi:pSer/pThr/pTyr-binding forkhead associated (FHA) protein